MTISLVLDLLPPSERNVFSELRLIRIWDRERARESETKRERKEEEKIKKEWARNKREREIENRKGDEKKEREVFLPRFPLVLAKNVPNSQQDTNIFWKSSMCYTCVCQEKLLHTNTQKPNLQHIFNDISIGFG